MSRDNKVNEGSDDRESAIYAYKKIVEAYKGPLAGKIVEVLAKHGELTEDELADKVEANEADVRRIMWVLASEGLVISKKVSNETGWITFYWKLPLDQVDGLLLGLYRRVIDRLEKKLEYESSTVFYWCLNKNHEKLTFSEAVENMFKCPACGKTLIPYDNSELIAALNYCISEMKKIMKNYFIEVKETDGKNE